MAAPEEERVKGPALMADSEASCSAEALARVLSAWACGEGMISLGFLFELVLVIVRKMGHWMCMTEIC